MAGGTQIARRIPRIKFPFRRPPPAQASSAPGNGNPHTTSAKSPELTSAKESESLKADYKQASDVPAPPRNTSSGGSASIQPKRTPVSAEEIDAVLLGGIL